MFLDHPITTYQFRTLCLFSLYYFMLLAVLICYIIFLFLIMLEYMYACRYDFLYFLSDLRSDFCVLLMCFLNLQTSVDVSKIHNELNEKSSEIRRLQIELSTREDEDPNVNVKSLKRVIATLEKENANLKVSCILKCHPCKKCAMHCYETWLGPVDDSGSWLSFK